MCKTVKIHLQDTNIAPCEFYTSLTTKENTMCPQKTAEHQSGLMRQAPSLSNFDPMAGENIPNSCS